MDADNSGTIEYDEFEQLLIRCCTVLVFLCFLLKKGVLNLYIQGV